MRNVIDRHALAHLAVLPCFESFVHGAPVVHRICERRAPELGADVILIHQQEVSTGSQKDETADKGVQEVRPVLMQADA